MRFCKKLKFASVLCGLSIGLLSLNMAQAKDHVIVGEASHVSHIAQSQLLIRSAKLSQVADDLFLNTAIDIRFNQAINKALLKGFTLHYILEFQLSVPRKYWFSDEIVTITRPIEVGYHALTRQYVLRVDGKQKSYRYLSDLATGLRQLSPIPVIAFSQLSAEKTYEAALLIRLDYRKLPSGLQAQAKADWQMTSQRANWQPTLF